MQTTFLMIIILNIFIDYAENDYSQRYAIGIFFGLEYLIILINAYIYKKWKNISMQEIVFVAGLLFLAVSCFVYGVYKYNRIYDLRIGLVLLIIAMIFAFIEKRLKL